MWWYILGDEVVPVPDFLGAWFDGAITVVDPGSKTERPGS
jgi:hypothetical protein